MLHNCVGVLGTCKLLVWRAMHRQRDLEALTSVTAGVRHKGDDSEAMPGWKLQDQ